jgi:hypothetical protein
MEDTTKTCIRCEFWQNSLKGSGLSNGSQIAPSKTLSPDARCGRDARVFDRPNHCHPV